MAAIGGMKKLPKSYVSHEVNNLFSKLEKRFSRESLISMIRQFEGPGKRGNLNDKKASKSNICVISSQEETEDIKEKYSLGYIKLAKPYVINHFIFSFETDTIAISLDPNLVKDNVSQEQAILNFIESAKSFKEYTLIVEENLPNTLALFGESDKQWFLAVKDKELASVAQKFIETIMNSESVDMNESKKGSSQVKAYQHYNIDLEGNNRIIAKMAFNLLASEKGFEFVLESKFDLIRDWIYLGTNNLSFVEMIPRDKDLEERLIPFCPDKAHYIIIIQEGDSLIALVSFYGEAYSHIVKLADLDSDEIVLQYPIGLICDWKNRKEYSLLEHISTITELE
ncbi:hypothetical protein [Sporosarcina highlanderae]|uniref:Uncharacterized protein n=1 Tax=Sporosarcina highlanderae TaxID=3035916 RepID=A0ABT8JS16_9BACL|nr:hypothetical protein [Sporosarcina highlanderae]MDN4607905.1 hypothetical protein [Sporosarcina highlanderae]